MHFSQGWVQFGYRFSNDFAPFALVLVTLAIAWLGDARGLRAVGRARRAVGARQCVGRLLGSHTGLVSSSVAELAAPCHRRARAAGWSRLTERSRLLLAARDRVRARAAAVHAHAACPTSTTGTRPSSRRLARCWASPTRPATRPTRCCCGSRRSCSSRSATRRCRANLLSALLVAGACAIVGVIGRLPDATARRRHRRRHRLRGHARASGRSRCTPIPTRSTSSSLRCCCCCSSSGPTDSSAAHPHADRLLIAAAVVFGVSLANHALTVLLAPGIGLYVLLVYPGILRRAAARRGCVGALRADHGRAVRVPAHPLGDEPAAWTTPTRRRWDNFLYVVFGEQFTGTFHSRPSCVDVAPADRGPRAGSSSGAAAAAGRGRPGRAASCVARR